MLRLIFEKMARVSVAGSKQFLAHFFVVGEFSPPAPVGVNPLPMPTDVYSTFIPAFVVVLEHGTENAPGLCKSRVAKLRKDFKDVQELRQTYPHHHCRPRQPIAPRA